MAKVLKLERCQYPPGTSPADFKCFGPAATVDCEFDSVKMADMGCFTQEGKDSNKFYHCAIVVDRSGNWYVFIQYGRQGVGVPQFQFIPCASEAEAQRVFADQCAEKNTKRGEWQTIGGVKLFRPRIGKDGKPKDLYVVRSLASRTTGLPDAKNITASIPVTTQTKTGKAKKTYRCDPETTRLMRDFLGGTVTYARTTIQGGNIPGQAALDQGRNLLDKAKLRVATIGHDVTKQIADNELRELTYAVYSLIPKIKPLHCSEDKWLLNQGNIVEWEHDIDVFESALKTGVVEEVEEGDDPMHGLPVEMEWIDLNTELGKYLNKWWLGATRNRHGNVGSLKIHGLWKVKRTGEMESLREHQERIHKEMPKNFNGERALHQDIDRVDLDKSDRKFYWETNTALTFHGTRSVNCSGILREGFRFPKELKKIGVTINGAALGEGCYQADDYKKSCGYCSSPKALYAGGDGGGIKNRHAFMFACDTVLGNPHTAEQCHGYTAPPTGTHCVFGKAEHTATYWRGYKDYLQNNEWVTFTKGTSVLRYLAEVSW
jgi:hypothetical protein